MLWSLLDKVIRFCESCGFFIELSVEVMFGIVGGGYIYEFGLFGMELICNFRNVWWYYVVLLKLNVYGFEVNWGKFFYLLFLSVL